VINSTHKEKRLGEKKLQKKAKFFNFAFSSLKTGLLSQERSGVLCGSAGQNTFLTQGAFALLCLVRQKMRV
jgi:hypothetical protein